MDAKKVDERRAKTRNVIPRHEKAYKDAAKKMLGRRSWVNWATEQVSSCFFKIKLTVRSG